MLVDVLVSAVTANSAGVLADAFADFDGPGAEVAVCARAGVVASADAAALGCPLYAGRGRGLALGAAGTLVDVLVSALTVKPADAVDDAPADFDGPGAGVVAGAEAAGCSGAVVAAGGFFPFVALGARVAAFFGATAALLPLAFAPLRSVSSSSSASSESESHWGSGSCSRSSSSSSSPATSANMRPVMRSVSSTAGALTRHGSRMTTSDLTNAACMKPFPNAMVFKNTSGLPIAISLYTSTWRD